MSSTRRFALLIALLPSLVVGKGQSRSCGLAYEMEQVELPQDLAVKADPMTGIATKIAMDWWTARLSTPARPVTWHLVDSPEQCMIYIRYSLTNWKFDGTVVGYTRMPGNPLYDGVATLKLPKAWVAAHEIGHLIGCRHGVGVMREGYASDDRRLSLDDRSLHYARLVRLQASVMAGRLDSVASAAGPRDERP